MFCRHCGMRQPNHSLTCALFASHSAVKPARKRGAKRLTCPITNLAHDPGYYCDACGDIAADKSAR
jgi:hypothetical protein